MTLSMMSGAAGDAPREVPVRATSQGSGMAQGGASGGPHPPLVPFTRAQATALAEAAGAAPSVHNTQPWRLRAQLATRLFELYADPARMLRRADPHGREVHISCGAALFNLRIAISCAGSEPVTRLLPRPDDRLLMATVRLAGPAQPRPGDQGLYRAIRHRHTSRRPFCDTPVAAAVLARLAEAAALEGTILRFPGPGVARRVLEESAAADRAFRADPDYLAELASWAGGQRAGDGIPASALGPRPLGGPAPVRDLSVNGPRLAPGARYEALPQLAVLCTRGPGPADWLRAGQAMQRVLLLADQHGVAASPLTQALEIADTALLREFRTEDGHPQVILRLGYGEPGPPTPRRQVAEILQVVAEEPG